MLPDELINKIVMMNRPTYPWIDEYYERCQGFGSEDKIDFVIYYFGKKKFRYALEEHGDWHEQLKLWISLS